MNTSSIFDKDFNTWHQLLFDLFVIIWWLFDDYLLIICWLFDHYLHYCDYLLYWNVIVNDSPVFAFARLCCLTIPVARPALPAKVTSDLLDSSLQGVPRELRCRRWAFNERKDANSKLQFMHLKFKNRSVCLLWVWLVWRSIGNLSECNASDWASWLPLAALTVLAYY